MAAVLEGLLPSRRRPSRSQSESGKQLHSRWGDTSISAPNYGGWSQHYLEDDLNNVVYQARGSPDSQKTLVDDSPNPGFKDDIEKVSIEEIREPTPPLVQKERGAITITIPLFWSRKNSRRNSASSNLQVQAAQVVERVVTAESRPGLTNITTNVDDIIVAESRPAPEPYRAVSPILHPQSPVYDDVSTFFTRAAFPEKHPGSIRLPQIQTSVPINKSQPASAISTISNISILSPVAEKYNGLSESNNVTPMDNTPIAQQIATAIPVDNEGVIDVSALASRLATHAGTTPTSYFTGSIGIPDPIVERSDSRSTARVPSRPSSRGPGLGEIGYMRASSRGVEGRRSASREPTGRRPGSVEPQRRRALSREPRRRAESPGRNMSRAYSRDAIQSRSTSREPMGRRALSREPAVPPQMSPELRIGRDLSMEPVRPRAESPGPATRRAQSREPAGRRDISPVKFTRRAISRDPISRQRRDSGDYARRAASVDPIPGRASPHEDVISRRGTPVIRSFETDASADEATSDDATDIETETEEMYFESRKGWNGAAVVGAASKGFYGDVIQDYKLIAKDVVDESQVVVPARSKSPEPNVVSLFKKEMEGYKKGKRYRGPTLVPDNEELWG